MKTMVTIQIAKIFQDIKVDSAKIQKVVHTVCNRFNVSAGTVIIAIVDDAETKKLNKQFLGRGSITDCLSFDLPEDSLKSDKFFELVVNGQMAVREAKLRGHSSEAELALYIIHCLLHNLGFDDSTVADAEKMHKVEDEILQQLGFGIVYNA